MQYVVALFFFGLMATVANPFASTSGFLPLDGRGPNPLLQDHPLVAFHPPFLYSGYVGMTIPFSFAIAALVTGRFGEGWLADTRRASLIAWGFLTVGIVLGAWWSYEVLGWGGYWSWDPVENASLLPWLTMTAFLHSVMVQERRGMLRVWNLSLIIATFALTILGTFLTRSGVITSVHAFTQSAIGPALLGFFGLVILTGLALIAWRGDLLHAPGRIDAVLSRESAFLANNLLFTGFAFVVFTGTVFPLLVEALQNRQISVGSPYFERMTTPLGLALLFMMAIGPILPWRAVSGEVLRDRLLVPLYSGAIVMVLAVVFSSADVAGVLAYGLAAFCAAGIVRNFVVAVRARRAALHEPVPRAFTGTVRGNPRRWGGLVVHLGVVMIAVALAASQGSATARSVQLKQGESATVAGQRITYLGSSVTQTAQKATLRSRFAIHDGGSSLGVYAPAISTYPNVNQGIATPSVHVGVLRDVYLSLVAAPDDSGRVSVQVLGEPDGVVAVARRPDHGARHDPLPRTEAALGRARDVGRARRRRGDVRRQRRRRRRWPRHHRRARAGRAVARTGMTRIRWIVAIVSVVVVGVGVLLAVNLGGDPTKPFNATVGHLAPDFRLTAFDGKPIDLGQLRGRVVLVNFWNDWCDPCQQETPSLVSLAKAHTGDAGFAMVGIVHDPQTCGAVKAYATKNHMTYPLAFDPGENTSLDYGVTGQPETFVIDKAGVVSYWFSGPIDANDIERRIEQLEAT